MSREFRFRPFHALLFLPLLFFSSFLGLLVFVMPALLLLLVSTTLHDRYLDLWTGMWMTVAPVRKKISIEIDSYGKASILGLSG